MKDQFLKLAEIANKICVPSYYSGHSYWIYKDKHKDKDVFVLYSRETSPFGSEWIYLHDAITGNFVQSFNAGFSVPATKERLLKADLVKFQSVHFAKKQHD